MNNDLSFDAEMIKMKGLKGHAAQKFLQQCRVDIRGPGKCSRSGHRFGRVSLLWKHLNIVLLLRIVTCNVANLCIMSLQGEARVLIDNNGKKEAYTLDAASDELAPLLKQAKGSTHGALEVQVIVLSLCDESIPSHSPAGHCSTFRQVSFAGHHKAEGGSEAKILHRNP